MRASAASPFRQPRSVATTLTRLGPLSSPCRAGNVKILRGAWSVELFRILEGLPDLAHDDEVDASSGSLEILNLQMRNWGPRKPIAYRQQAEHLRVKKGRLMRRQPKAQTLAPLAGNRGFESTSLHRRIACEPDFLDQARRLCDWRDALLRQGGMTRRALWMAGHVVALLAGEHTTAASTTRQPPRC